jgi:hypothetical protein
MMQLPFHIPSTLTQTLAAAILGAVVCVGVEAGSIRDAATQRYEGCINTAGGVYVHRVYEVELENH